MNKIVALATSDWHFWQTAPIWRSAEENWLQAMARPLKQLINFQQKHGGIPVFVAGDIFDHPNPNPEAINFLIDILSENFYAVPGQHDLVNHLLEKIEQTGFQTLVKAGKLNYLAPGKTNVVNTVDGKKLNVIAKPWRIEYDEDCAVEGGGDLNILVAHEYIYCDDSTKYVGADEDGDIKSKRRFLRNFDVAVYGDNHIPFIANAGRCKVVNCGTMVRRKLDEAKLETGFVAIYEDGSVKRILFDNSEDKYIEVEVKEKKTETDDEKFKDFIKELENLDTMSIDFSELVKRELAKRKTKKQVVAIFEKIFEENKE